LEAALKDADKAVQVKAAESLCGVPGQWKKAMPLLTAALNDRTLRTQAIGALGWAGADARDAVPALLAALHDETKDYAFAARVGRALRQITGAESAETLFRAFEQSLKRFRPLIAQALAETGPAG